MGKLDGKIAMITGGSSGIGLATATLFASEGARVVISGRNRKTLDDALHAIGSNALAIEGDVADPDHHVQVAEEISARYGGLDIYMANAGINKLLHSSEVSPEDFATQFGVNTRAVFFGVQKMAPLIRNGGAIVLTGSLATQRVFEAHSVYAGSKAAIGAFARSWALEFKDRGIRVNILTPGPTDTTIIEKMGVSPEQRDAFVAATSSAIPLGRLGEPAELARAALFLASNDSSFITGIDLRVDGGMALL